MTNIVKFLMLSIILLESGCVYNVQEEMKPLAEGGLSYSVPGGVEGEEHANWWFALNDPELDALITRALEGNFGLREAYARIGEAAALGKAAGALTMPSVNASLSGTSTWDDEGEKADFLSMELGLSWEVDLWRGLSSSKKAAVLESEAAVDELVDAALVLTSRVADVYYQIIEQAGQLEIISDQIEASETYLDLVKLRFTNGDASLLDIYQQRQQLAELRSQIPPVRSRLRVLENRISVLLGFAPQRGEIKRGAGLPQLPPLPELGIPAELLMRRPDIRARNKKLVAADYRVAEAVAERLPSIRLGGSTGVRGETLSSEYSYRSLFSELIMPLVDWGRRKAEVERRKAIVEGELSKYTEAYLNAIEEVENALVTEREGRLLIESLEEHLKVSKANLLESRNRYMQGLNDYLPLLTALQSVQRLEREILLEKRKLISNRILLYRALGGDVQMKNVPVALKGKGTLR